MPHNLPFWLLTVAYSAHIMEEYFLNWKKWAEETSGLKMEWSEFLVANFAVIILGIAASCIGFNYPPFSFLFIGLASVNALFAHIGTTIVKRRFAPGTITSIFLFLPICGWAYFIAYQKGILSASLLLTSLGGGFIIMLFPVLLQLIKRKWKM